ncbi:MTH1187 family thiamine-binding protein [Bacillus sp. Marseille-Q3570]|uniref:MTH1187 family thiamine-binding protein n=1 Tax=Bacillus sp. Marseille-Q3570 TaxID=2963522 RepID=UPI0021B6FCCE|nr:MTH1187 family thiamine-binding protein [Bacillus sp. Marseille-Q3570]
MAIVDVTVVPLGTKTPSMSDYVAEVQKVLDENSDKISYQLTPMSTLIEGDLGDLFDVIQQIHEVPFKNGIERVSTNIRLDDRRDKQVKMEDKLKSVEEKT